MLTKVWTVQHLAEMLEPEQNQNHLIEVLERLCLAVENLTEDLRPELKKTATLERRKKEAEELKISAAKAVELWKRQKKKPDQSD